MPSKKDQASLSEIKAKLEAEKATKRELRRQNRKEKRQK
jgi:hypothetical protein